jgi:hypothetical protein
MATGERADPVRSTLVAILQQLNKAESMNEGRRVDQVLELVEIERLLDRFWAVERDHVKIPLALGLLVRNGLVEVQAAPNNFPKAAKDAPRVHYHITAEGKKFLVEALQKTDRIA